MIKPDFAPGFYGKLPSHGDFVTRRLPRPFIEQWDSWLQGSLAASREQLAGDWLDIYLVSPIWQFALAPGLCGTDAWAGVMMPSVDRVGRYFPLTLAARIDEEQIPGLFADDCAWLTALSELALSSLDYQFDLQAFDDSLEGVRLNDFLRGHTAQFYGGTEDKVSGRLAFQIQLGGEDNAALTALERLAGRHGTRFLQRCSVWRSLANENAEASMLVCEGMPPLDAFIGFLNGCWPDRGWRLTHIDSAETLCAAPSPAAEMPCSEAYAAETANDSDDNTLPPVEPGGNGKSWHSQGLSVVGLRRRLNEDAILNRPEAGMWVVADGMGGHSAGDVASQALVNALAMIKAVDDIDYFSEQVASCLHAVNRELVQLAQSRGSGHIIGTTVVVLLISGHQFSYLWAGDSRLYRYRQGELQQLTNDHSLYNESLAQGLEPLDGSLEQGRGNIITRAVGADPQLQLDCGLGELEPGDLFLLTSDGIDKELNHDEIRALCASGSVGEIAENLVREAEARGGRDNISVVVVKNS